MRLHQVVGTQDSIELELLEKVTKNLSSFSNEHEVNNHHIVLQDTNFITFTNALQQLQTNLCTFSKNYNSENINSKCNET
jgi:hypothetical protein